MRRRNVGGFGEVFVKAPMPYFGGKSRVASLVWERLGQPVNYVEPFFGSGAVLLARQWPHGMTETVNDLDAYLSNFYRAVQGDPDSVAFHADFPVSEVDILARHKWLLEQGRGPFTDKMKSDPSFYDAKIAGWWLYGICAWIGSGWCKAESKQLPHLGTAGMGINRKLPHLGDAGRGINRKLPHLGDAGRAKFIRRMMRKLSQRLRDVRVACGDWKRVLGDSVTFKHGITGVFLDPPYSHKTNSVRYASESGAACIFDEVRQWAIDNGNNKLLRIALCGYDDEREMPSGWDCIAWKTNGGFANQGGKTKGKENKHKERIWFSPACIKPSKETQIGLFDEWLQEVMI